MKRLLFAIEGVIYVKRPLIGVTPCYNYKTNETFIRYGYCEGINKSGGLAMLLPVTGDDELLHDIVERCDGILISGGPDIDAKFYGENNMPYNGEISPHRDYLEVYIAKKAIELNKPLYGICRGIQVMNVALGGTLYQDIYTQIDDCKLVKHAQDAPKWYPTHDISIEKGSRVWKSFMKDRIRVNSFHHQAVRDVAPGFRVTSRAPDGIVESIELEGHIFAVGVQWHPELMWNEYPEFLGLFMDFIDSCKNQH